MITINQNKGKQTLYDSNRVKREFVVPYSLCRPCPIDDEDRGKVGTILTSSMSKDSTNLGLESF